MDIDRNLLFGLIALQADLIAPTQLMDAVSSWAHRRERPLADLLQDRGWITSRDRATVDYLMDRRLKKYGGNLRASLAAAADPSIRAALLTAIRDRDVLRSIADLPPHHAPTSGISSAPRGRERFTLSNLTTLDAISQTWTARDEELGREVALKELRPEAVKDAASCERFLREARLLGQLEHPGILPLYELSQNTTTGIPFCTLRLARGRSLAEAIRSYHDKRQSGETNRVEFRNLLLAFLDVCRAIAFAHSRLVVHLDLQPRRVLLGEFGEAVVCEWDRARKLSDLLAQAEASGHKGRTALSTDSDAALETLSRITSYSAPEQAQGRIAEFDTSTDVYALGAILYEILTGQPPFAEASEDDLRRQIVEDLPTPPRRLAPGVPAALEAIALKALSKRRGERYARAGDLVLDLERWMADEPIQAWAESLPNRIKRWMRRNRPLVQAGYIGIGFVVLVLLALVVVLESGWAEAKRGQAAAVEEKSRMEYALRRAHRLIDETTQEIAAAPPLREGELASLRRRLLENMAQYHADAKFYLPGGGQFYEEQAEAYLRLARIYGELGDAEKALAALSDARDALNRVILEQPRNYTARLNSAHAEGEMGRQWKALGHIDQALTSLRSCVSAYDSLPAKVFSHPERVSERISHTADLIELLLTQNQLEEADLLAQRGFRILQETLKTSPDSVSALSQMVRLRTLQGDLARRRGLGTNAINLYREALHTAEDLAARNQNYRPVLVQSYRKLGQALKELAQFQQSAEVLREGLAVGNQLVRAFPVVSAFRADLVALHAELADVFLHQGNLGEAEAEARRAIDLSAQLRRDAALFAQCADEVAGAYLTLARSARRRGNAEEAAQHLGAILTLAQDLRNRNVDAESVRSWEAEAHRWLARLAAQARRYEDAHKALDQALAVDPQASADMQADRIAVWAAEGKAAEAIEQSKALLKDRLATAPGLMRAAVGLAIVAERGSEEQRAVAEELLPQLLAEARHRAGTAFVHHWHRLADDPDAEPLRKLSIWQRISDSLQIQSGSPSPAQP